MRYLIVFVALFFALQSFATNNVEKWEFKSKHSHFFISVKNNNLYLGGKKVDGSAFDDFKKMFDSTQAYEDCPYKLGNPDVTITAHTLADQKVSRFFYYKERLVGYADKCLRIQGQAIYRTPATPKWFLSAQLPTLPLHDGFTLKLKDKTLSYKKVKKYWQSQTEGFYTHWSYFNSFIEAFKNPEAKEIYDLKILPELKSSKQFSLHISKKTYKFYEVYSGVWGLVAPNSSALVTSNNWGNFSLLSLEQLTATYAPNLKKLLENPKDQDELTKTVRKISPIWNQDVKNVYLSVIARDDISDASRFLLFKELKKHPSKDVLSKLTVVFLVSQDLNLLSNASKILRIQYPEGPVINNKDTLEVQRPQLLKWEKIALNAKKS